MNLVSVRLNNAGVDVDPGITNVLGATSDDDSGLSSACERLMELLRQRIAEVSSTVGQQSALSTAGELRQGELSRNYYMTTEAIQSHLSLAPIACDIPTPSEERALGVVESLNAIRPDSLKVWGADLAEALLGGARQIALRIVAQCNIPLAIASFVHDDNLEVVLENRAAGKRLTIEAMPGTTVLWIHLVSLAVNDLDKTVEVNVDSPMRIISDWLRA